MSHDLKRFNQRVELSNNAGCVIIKRKQKTVGEVMPTHVMTSFRDSIAFSSVILSGLSSDVCFFMSAVLEERESLLRSRKAGGDENRGEKGERKRNYRQINKR